VLVKPQFEVGRGEVGKGGIVRDPAQHARVVEEVNASARALGLSASEASRTRPSKALTAIANFSRSTRRVESSKLKVQSS
jgi:predicted rRNA methylase YqxC with S4 and FtsJ domains